MLVIYVNPLLGSHGICIYKRESVPLVLSGTLSLCEKGLFVGMHTANRGIRNKKTDRLIEDDFVISMAH